MVLPIVLALAACAGPDGGGDPMTPGTRVLRDVAYAPAEPADSRGHLLDLYLPPRSATPTPVVIFSHGSGWLAENGRDGAEIVAAELNPRGYAVAGVAVRSSAHARFPGQLHDVKAAIRYLRSVAGEHGLDPDAVVTMGESSGGWVAAMAALTGDRPELEGELGVTGPSSRVSAAIPFYPPTDFLQMDQHMIDCGYFDRVFGLRDCHRDPRSPESLLLGCPIASCPERVAAANPISYVTPGSPPLLILHGTADLLVPHHQGELLHDAMRAAGADSTLVTVPGGEHGHWDRWLAGEVAVPAGQPTPDWATVLAFLARTAPAG